MKLMHEATGHVVSVELKSGELYRGTMIECEDNWNCQLDNITFTAKVLFLSPGFSFLGTLYFVRIIGVSDLFVFKFRVR